MIVCLISAVVNLLIGIYTDNPNPWYNWMASGFCFGLFSALAMFRIGNK